MNAFLINFATGKIIRKATAAEHAASVAQIDVDGIGLIVVDGVECITETDVSF